MRSTMEVLEEDQEQESLNQKDCINSSLDNPNVYLTQHPDEELGYNGARKA